MQNQNAIRIFLVFAVLITVASICGNGSGEDEAQNTPTFTPKPPQALSVATEEVLPPPVPPDRCAYFENKEVKFVFHTLVEGDEFMVMYIYMEGGWPGKELVMTGDPGPYEFHATFGGLESIHCNFLEYENRLYCTFPLSKPYYNTAQHFKLYILGCPIPIVEHTYLSILVETLPPGAPPAMPTMPPSCECHPAP